jgi:hypothetical protein
MKKLLPIRESNPRLGDAPLVTDARLDIVLTSYKAIARIDVMVMRGRVPTGGSRGVTAFRQPPGLALPACIEPGRGHRHGAVSGDDLESMLRSRMCWRCRRLARRVRWGGYRRR